MASYDPKIKTDFYSFFRKKTKDMTPEERNYALMELENAKAKIPANIRHNPELLQELAVALYEQSSPKTSRGDE